VLPEWTRVQCTSRAVIAYRPGLHVHSVNSYIAFKDSFIPLQIIYFLDSTISFMSTNTNHP